MHQQSDLQVPGVENLLKNCTLPETAARQITPGTAEVDLTF